MLCLLDPAARSLNARSINLEHANPNIKMSRSTVVGSAQPLLLVALFVALRICPSTAKPSPPFLHMPLDFKDLKGVGIAPELVALTEMDTAPGSEEVAVEVGSRGIDARVHVEVYCSPITAMFQKVEVPSAVE